MKKHILFFAFAFIFSSTCFAQSLLPQWISNHSDNGYSAITLGFIVDSTGNSYVLANIQDTSSTQNASGDLILKYDPLGQLLWVDSLQGIDLLTSKMQMGKDGFVYLATPDGNGGFRIVKISPAGNFLWQNTFPAGHFVASVNGMVISDSLNIFLISTSTDQTSAEILKCDASGNFLWNASYNYPAGSDRGNAITVDHFGNTYAAIASMDSVNLYDLVIAKYSPAGQLAWQRRSGAFQWQTPNFIQTYQDSMIIVSGICTNTLGQGDFLTQRYNSNGNLVWSRSFNADSVLNHSFNRPDTPTAMLITHTGNIALTGRCADNGMPLWMNVMYDLQGTLKWVRQDFAATSRPNTVVEDHDCHLIFAGDGADSLNPFGMAISKYDTLGNLQWSSTYNYAPQTPAIGTHAAVDYMGNIYCTGVISLGANTIMTTTLKYDRSVNVQEQGSNDVTVLVYPNPATDQVTFSFTEITGEVAILLYDELGQEISSQKVTGSSATLQTNNFAAGIYFYRVGNEKVGFNAGKLLIQ